MPSDLDIKPVVNELVNVLTNSGTPSNLDIKPGLNAVLDIIATNSGTPTVTIQNNGTDVTPYRNKLNFIGSVIASDDIANNRTNIVISGGGGGGSTNWGSISGTLSNQSDLSNALALKANTSAISVVGYDNNYLSLDNKPFIPSTKSDIGLPNVDNTSDLNKPISIATQNALDAKQGVITNSDSITQGVTNLFLTVGERGKLANTTNTNTGDETLSSIKSKLGITTLSGSNTGDQTTITGNAGSATVLETSRAINGVAFNGSGDITIFDNTKLTKTGDTISGDIANTSTGFFQIASGTTIQRPSSPQGGMGRYNIDTARKESFEAGAWRNYSRLSGDAFTGNISATNLSGTNTGDETLSSIQTKLGITTLSGSNTGDQDLSGLLVKTNNLSDLTNTSNARANLGLAIGTNVQAYSANTTILGNSTTGTGSIVLGSSPSLVSPILGDATVTSINKVSVTQPANGSVLTIQDGVNLTVSGNTNISGVFSGSSSGSNTGDQTTITGNAGSATILQTSRNINGVAFNGSADITIFDDTKLAKAGDTITGDIANTSTGFLQTPQGTTAQRPATPLSGMRRYNTTTTRDEFYAAGAWQNHARLSGDTFTGNITATNLSGTNTGDQASIVGITGTTAQFNTALTDNDFATLAGTETLTNKISVAIGTPTASDLLHVKGGNVTGIRTESTAACTVFDMYSISGRTFSWRTNFNTTGLELTRSTTTGGNPTTTVLHSDVSGNIRIGGLVPATPLAKLEVAGTILATNLSGSNTGDQTSISGITGTTTQFNAALSDDDFVVLSGTQIITGVKNFGANDTLFGAGVLDPNSVFGDFGNLGTTTGIYLDARSTNLANVDIIMRPKGTGTFQVTKNIIGSGTITATNLTGTNTGDQTLNSLLPTQTGNNGKVLQTDGVNATWQTVSGGGGIGRSINSISSNTTLSASANTDYIYLVSGTTTVTLPTAIGNTNKYEIKNTGTNTVTIATTSSQTIDGSTTASLTPNTSLTLISDNSNFFIL